MDSDFPFRLTIPSELRMLSIARAFVEAVCQTRDLERGTVQAIVVAAGEAISNVIRHAHRDRSQAQVQIHCQLDVGVMEILLLDEGEPFDIGAVPHLDPGELRVGGRGVFLMRSLMDELTCQPRRERGNVLRMIKRFPAKSPVRECG